MGVVLLIMNMTCSGPRPAARNTSVPTAIATAAATIPAPFGAPKPDELDSAWVSQTAAATLAVGAETTMSFSFRNAGKAAWVRGAASEVRLGYVGDSSLFDPRMAVGWPNLQRPAVQTEAIVPAGQIATFSFKVRGVTAGTFRLDVRPVVDGIAWLRNEGVYAEVTVR